MRDEFEKYLQSIALSATLTERVRAIHDFYQPTIPDELKWIFITDYITQEGERIFDSLWFFTSRHAMEAKQFTSTDDYDVAAFQTQMTYFRIRKQDYDLKKANDKSRLLLSFQVNSGVSGEIKASKENCDHLWQLVCDYFIPRLK
jgi:hypothetical protein